MTSPTTPTPVLHTSTGNVPVMDATQAILSQLPLFDNIKKTDYLGYRACGFSVREACMLAETTTGVIKNWRKWDKEFLAWEQNIPQLQGRISPMLMSFQFSRNMHMVLQIDKTVLFKAAFNEKGIESLSDDEKKLLPQIMSRYKTTDLIGMQKATQPNEGDEDGPRSTVNIQINVGDKHFAKVLEQQAAAEALLEKFSVHQEYIDGIGEVIDD